MKSSFLPKVGAVMLSASVLAWSLPAKALDFGFSFNNTSGNTPGTVTGTVTGLPTSGTGSAASVIVNSSPFGSQTFAGGGSFNVSGGTVTSATFTGSSGGLTLTFSGSTIGNLVSGTSNVQGPVNFSAAGAAAAPWEFNPTFGVLLALLPFGVGYARNQAKKRKKEVLPYNIPSEGVKA